MSDKSAYFQRLSAALVAAGVARPCVLIDKARLDRNIQYLKDTMPAACALRIATKSLPSMPLINYMLKEFGTNRLMTFSAEMLGEISTLRPEAEQLLGKPVPAAAARNYLAHIAPDAGTVAGQVQWLIDSPLRLRQYSEIAASLNLKLRINLEIDVGLHRGGLPPGNGLKLLLDETKADPNLCFSGFMGYDAHLPILPSLFGIRRRAIASADAAYRDCVETALSVFGEDASQDWCFNSGGSPSYSLHSRPKYVNDITVGSALVKPANFDTEFLKGFVPASFIATPVLKVTDKFSVPAFEFLEPIARRLRPGRAKTVYIHGGLWPAKAEYPNALSFGKLARSSNQDKLCAPLDLPIEPDDFVFFRPNQSERTFLHFGEIIVIDGGKVADKWKPLRPYA